MMERTSLQAACTNYPPHPALRATFSPLGRRGNPATGVQKGPPETAENGNV
jgi:hypothetical protein